MKVIQYVLWVHEVSKLSVDSSSVMNLVYVWIPNGSGCEWWAHNRIQ